MLPIGLTGHPQRTASGHAMPQALRQIQPHDLAPRVVRRAHRLTASTANMRLCCAARDSLRVLETV
eukprot:3620302-Prorocentrum_lima.AAC.1